MSRGPNILLFLMDGVQSAVIRPDSPCITPHMDLLCREGIRFDRAYTTCPTCSPARASLMTGLVPHNHGVLEVEHGRDPDQVRLRTDKPHWAQQLQANGYDTAYFGKWHIERTNKLEDFGWGLNRCKAAEHHQHLGQGRDLSAELPIDPRLSRHVDGPTGYNRILHYGVTDTPAEERYPAYSVDQVLEYLDERQQSADPWCACVSFSEPNESLVVSRESFERYDLSDVPLPENLNDDLSDRPNLYQRQRDISEGVTDDQWRMARACYFGRITELDDQLGRLLQALDESGELENTIVIVTADHGRYVGSHGFDAHNCGPFEEIYRVPLIATGPGISSGSESSAIVSLMDLCPTILELTGSDPIDNIDAASFAPVLSLSSEATLPSGFENRFAEYHGTRFRLTQRILWEGDWKFVFNGFDHDELYDLANDPSETRNLAREPNQQDRVQAMLRTLWGYLQDTGDRTLLESHYYSMRIAEVGPKAARG